MPPVADLVVTVRVALVAVEAQALLSTERIESMNSLRYFTPRHCCFSCLSKNS